MAFLGPNDILVLEKDRGTVRRVINGSVLPDPVLYVPVANQGERGMLGIALTKSINRTSGQIQQFAFIYLVKSGGGKNGDDSKGVKPLGNMLYRYEFVNGKLINPKLLLNLPTGSVARHNGGMVIVGQDGYVYLVVGDKDHRTKAENNLTGSDPDGTGGILRVGQDGEVPPSVIGEGTFSKYYYAYGIRNSFGLAFDPISGNLWDTENGPDTGDEVNLVKPGFNSGWQVVTGKISSSSELLNKLELFNGKGHYSNPEFSWNQTVAPTAIDFFNSSNFGDQYQGNAFVGDYNGGEIYSFKLNETRTGFVLPPPLVDHVSHSYADDQYVLFGNGFGGVTDLKTGPDGCLYVSSFYQGAIYRILSATENNTISR
jgi:aldose sugar dehydrogenase